MTEEEYFRKTYPDSCYGDRPLSPHFDFFQDGVEFGERQSEKKIEELEETIVNLKKQVQSQVEATIELDKENVNLKIDMESSRKAWEKLSNEYKKRWKDCEKENAELKQKIYGGGYEMMITKKDADIILLEHQLKEQKNLHKSVCEQLTNTHRNLGNQLAQAKEIIKYLVNAYPIITKETLEKAEQFLKGYKGERNGSVHFRKY